MDPAPAGRIEAKSWFLPSAAPGVRKVEQSEVRVHIPSGEPEVRKIQLIGHG